MKIRNAHLCVGIPTALGNDAVSYTHLDVYKRQQVHIIKGIRQIFVQALEHRHAKADVGHKVAVHQDVYKRQASCTARRSGADRFNSLNVMVLQ